jgi:hypothetical protein
MEEVDMEGVEHKKGDDPYASDKKAEEMHERVCLRWAGEQTSQVGEVK